MHALMELTSIKSKCIFHNPNENAFVQHHAMSCTQKLYLQWLTSQKRMAFRWGRRQVRRERRKVRDRLLEAACFKPGFEGGMISLFDEYSTHAYMQHKIKKLRLLTQGQIHFSSGLRQTCQGAHAQHIIPQLPHNPSTLHLASTPDTSNHHFPQMCPNPIPNHSQLPPQPWLGREAARVWRTCRGSGEWEGERGESHRRAGRNT